MKKFFSKKSKPVASKNKKANWRQLTFRQTVSLLVLATIFLFGVSAYHWYQNIFTNPDRVLSDMLDKSLQTSSVQREVSQSQGENSIDQVIYLSFSPEIISNSRTVLSEVTTLGKTTVTTENIGTESTDYVRYTDIKVASDRDNNKRNFSNIVGVWGKRDSQPDRGQPASFLRDNLFSAVPFGNLNNGQRHEIKEEIKRLKLYQFREAKKESVNGRPVMTYSLDLDPHALVTVLSKYAEVTGVGGGSELNPALYEGAQKVPVSLQVDLLSRHVSKIEFLGSGRIEAYGSYNSFREVKAPKETIDVNELQNRLQSLEQQS